MLSKLNMFGNVLKQEGTSRDERYPPALDPANLVLDPRKLEDFIIYARRYARNIKFIGTGNNGHDAPATWEPFFSNGPVLLAAGIATIDLPEIKDVYDLLRKQYEQDKALARLAVVVDQVISRFSQLDRWYAAAGMGFPGDDLQLYIRSYLHDDLKLLLAIRQYIIKLAKEDTEDPATSFINRLDVWDLGGEPVSGAASFAGNTEEEKMDHALMTVNTAFESVFFVMKTLRGAAVSYFESASSRQHAPHTALYIAFAKLFSHVQNDFNGLATKHLDHYYQDVLAIASKPAQPDQAVVVMELVKGLESAFVPRGSVLSAGKDKTNRELIYCTQKDITVNRAALTALHTVHIARKDGQILQYYSRAMPVANGAPANNGFPLRPFGQRQRAAKTCVGIAIASSQLYLEKGERKITLRLQLSDDLHFSAYDTSLLVLKLTGEKGWIASDDAASRLTISAISFTAPGIFECTFMISIAQASAVIAFDPSIHPGRFNTHLPVLQILMKFPDQPQKDDPDILQYNTRIQQLNDLQSMRLAGGAIVVQVGAPAPATAFDGITQLEIGNHDSPLDSLKPFLPFTATPKVGSSFYIGCSDLYYKSIAKFSINIEWMLPDNFRSYYDKYFPPYDTNRFRATLSILKDKHWRKLKDVQLINPLQNNGKYISLSVNLADELSKNSTPDGQQPVSKFDADKPDGTLKLKLLYPDFGHEIYPQLITSTVMQKAAAKGDGVDFYKVVKQQLYDSVISIKLPDDIESRTGSLEKVVYRNLEPDIKDQQSSTSMNAGLVKVIQTFNGTNLDEQQIREVLQRSRLSPGTANVVNDDTLIARLVGFLKKIRLIGKEVYYDRDKQTVSDVVTDLKEDIAARYDNLMPSERELTALIINEINRIISQIAIRIVDELLIMRNNGRPDEKAVATLIRNEVSGANEVINDMIAKKISILLAAQDIPPKPYTPLINTIALHYSSTKALDSATDQFFEVVPFGVRPIAVPGRLFPRSILEHEMVPAVNGILLFGISQAKPREAVSLYLQMLQGSKKNDDPIPALQWWCFGSKGWSLLSAEHLSSDSTVGLQSSGIVEIVLPPDIVVASNDFDQQGLCWLAATIAGQPDAFPDLTGAWPQAVAVRFEPDGNDPAHLALPLPPRRISRFAESMPTIKKVTQPDASIGGRMAENEAEYYTRVSERLRHKNRAICNWDYERLILQEFPSVYKVKCINNYVQGQYLPGHVTIVPIMSMKNKTTGLLNLEMPRAAYLELRNMENFLLRRTSAFVKVHAMNAEINYVVISAKVKFNKGLDTGACLERLNEELVMFLTPWAASEHSGLSFSAKVYLSSIIRFIDDRAYTAYVQEVDMNQYTLDTTDTEKEKRLYLKTESGKVSLFETLNLPEHAILVSAPQHRLESI